MSVEVDPVFGCVLWTGRKDRDGYGRDGRRLAHIVAYERVFGPVPEGFELEHRCRRRACQAMHHLAPVTKSNNQHMRKWSYRARIKTCDKGHDMGVNEVVTPEGGRVCRSCHNEAKGPG